MNRGEDLDRLMRILNAWGAMNYTQLLGGMGAGFGDKLDSIVRAMSSDEIAAFARALNVNDPAVAQRFQLLLMTKSPDDFRAEVRSPGSSQAAQTPKTGCAVLIGVLLMAAGAFVSMSLLLMFIAFVSGCSKPDASTSQPKADPADSIDQLGENDFPVKVRAGRPVLIRKMTPVFGSGTYIQDSPEGMYLYAKYVLLVPDGKKEWAFVLHVEKGESLRLKYGPSDKSNSRFLITSDTNGSAIEPGTELFPESNYKVFDSSGQKEVFKWTAAKK